jgi:hypothetical protein
MSHFATIVILPTTLPVSRAKAEQMVAQQMAPFSENDEVPSYNRECFCVSHNGRKAWFNDPALNGEAIDTARSIFRKQFGEKEKRANALKYGDAEERYKGERKRLQKALDKEWEALIKPIEEGRKAAERKHPLYMKPDPACEDCHGTGLYATTYNPQSKWDWYQIGGRWTGAISGYDPNLDPRNWRTCDLCNGTGTRRQPIPNDPSWKPKKGVCNGCQQYRKLGVPLGKEVAFTVAEHEGDIATVGSLLKVDEGKPFIPFAVLTPMGEWAERGTMGWWAIVTDKKDDGAWKKQVVRVYEKYKENVAVLVDCHI